MILQLIYSLFFAAAAVSALLVVFSRHAVHAALFLVAVMLSISGIFVLIGAQLAAVLQVLVYAGAVMVLFLFVIMLLNLGDAGEMPLTTRGVRRAGVVFSLAFAAQAAAFAVRGAGGGAAEHAAPVSASASDVALLLLTRYLYAFEMTSALLLIAVVGAMALGRRSLAKPPRPAGPPAAG